MIPKDFIRKPSCYTLLGFQLARLADKGLKVSAKEILDLCYNHTLIMWLESKGVDFSLWSNEDKEIMNEEFDALASTEDFGIENDGIILLMAFCYEFIGNPPTRTVEDL